MNECLKSPSGTEQNLHNTVGWELHRIGGLVFKEL